MDYTGKTIKDIYIIKRNKEDFEKYSKIGGHDPIYDCKCLLCGKLFSKNITAIKKNKFGNCGCYMIRHDLTNKTFGNLTVIKNIGSNAHKEMVWECRCNCGETVFATYHALINGLVLYCKKCRYKIIGGKNRKYVKFSKRLFECYTNLKTRCSNKKQDTKNRYINRGITMCEEWRKDYNTFQNWALQNGYNDTLTIDRIDNGKGYFPENCRWVDRVVQANNRRTNVFIEFNGETKTMAMWSKELKIPYYYLQRYHNEMNLGEIKEKYDNNTRYKGKNR